MNATEIRVSSLAAGFIRYTDNVTCPVCGKAFWATGEEDWAYIVSKKKVCSYTCMRKAEREAEERHREVMRKRWYPDNGLTPMPVRKPDSNTPRNAISEETVANMKRMRAQGMKVEEISDICGVATSTVSTYTRGLAPKSNLIRPGITISQEIVAKMWEMYVSGMSKKAIAAELGACTKTIIKYIRKIETEMKGGNE